MIFDVVTVSLNDLPGLKRTARTITEQRGVQLNWIVVDGGSTDGTPQWLAEHEAELGADWISEPDDGIYDAMNKGLLKARGDYVVFMNAGDTFAGPDVLERVERAVLEGPSQPDLVYGDGIEVDTKAGRFYRKARSPAKLWRGMFIYHQSILFRTAMARRLRYDGSFQISGDYDLVARCVRAGGPALPLGFPICEFALGGRHETHLGTRVREYSKVRREVLGLPRPVVLALHYYDAINARIRRLFPYWSRHVRARRVR